MSIKEKDEEYRVPEYPNQEKGFILDEEKFGKFSKEIFVHPLYAILCAIYLNFVYIYSLKKSMQIFPMILSFLIRIIVIKIILKKYFKQKEEV